ncbi:MAG: ROK family protein [bacterium]
MVKDKERDKIYKLGIDIGGTKMSSVLVHKGKVIKDLKLATPKDNLKNFLNILKALIDPMLQKAEEDNAEVASIGIGLPGTIDFKENKVLTANNVPILDNVKIIDKLKEIINLDIPIKIDNDTNCFVRAESLLGAGKDSDNIYGIIIGTGIGGAWCIKKKIYTGNHGGAGEPGEMLIDLDNKITLEEAYKKLTQNNPRLLAQEAYEGDELAEKCFEELGEYLGLAFANIINIIDPEIIVIGGGGSTSSDLFLKTATKTMREHIHSHESKKIKIVKSKLGEHAGAIGAALLF